MSNFLDNTGLTALVKATKSLVSGKVDNNYEGLKGFLEDNLPAWTADPTDDTYFIRHDTNNTTRMWGKVKFSTLWNYIKGKTDAAYMPKGTGTTNVATKVVQYVAYNTTSKLGEWRMAIVNPTTTANNTYVYMSPYQLDLYCGSTTLRVNTSGIHVTIGGTSYTLDAAKAKELGVLK